MHYLNCSRCGLLTHQRPLANKRTLRIRHLNQSTPVCFRFQKMTCSLSPKASSIVGSRRTWPTYGCGCGSSTTTDASKLHSSSYAVSPSEALSMKGRALGLQKLEEMVNARRRDIGSGIWQIVRNRRDNLALGYVDSEHKSGATTTRDLQKSLRPGKCTAAIELDGWMQNHVDADAMVVIADDFAGSGQTLVDGVTKFKARVSDQVWRRFIDEGRLSVYVMFAFPEALEAVRRRSRV